jgi:hypothetical protein
MPISQLPHPLQSNVVNNLTPHNEAQDYEGELVMKLNLKLMLIIAAVYHFMNGILGLFAPLSMVGVTIDASTPMYLVMTMRFWGWQVCPLVSSPG